MNKLDRLLLMAKEIKIKKSQGIFLISPCDDGKGYKVICSTAANIKPVIFDTLQAALDYMDTSKEGAAFYFNQATVIIDTVKEDS